MFKEYYKTILYRYYLGATPIVHVVFREKGGNFPNFRKEIKEEINKKIQALNISYLKSPLFKT